MLKFRDFVPEQIKPEKLGFLGIKKGEYESFQAAVTKADDWMMQNGIAPVTVETVVLPNIHEKKEDGSEDPTLSVFGSLGTHWHQIVRVWYQGK